MQYHDPVINTMALCYQYTVTAMTFVVNFTLVALIISARKREIGSYCYLLLCFALSDLYYTVLHFATYPIPEMYKNVFLIRGHGAYPERFHMALYFGAYGHAFPLLFYHFLYRMLALKSPHVLKHLRLMIGALLLTILCANLTWFSVYNCMYTSLDPRANAYLRNLFDGSDFSFVIHTNETAHYYIHAVYWLNGTFVDPIPRNIVATTILGTMMFSVYVFIFYAVRSMLAMFRSMSFNHSKKSLIMQKQLFQTLIYQSVIPFVTANCPAGSIMSFPIFGLSFAVIAVICPCFCAIHPLLDGLVIIITVAEYRRTLMRWTGLARRPLKKNEQATATIAVSYFPVIV